jgi:hypothetical protein
VHGVDGSGRRHGQVARTRALTNPGTPGGAPFPGECTTIRPGAAPQCDAMAEWEYQHLYLPRGTSRGAARRLLTDHAEYGHWELDRLRLSADGSRRVILRRRVIKAVRTA